MLDGACNTSGVGHSIKVRKSPLFLFALLLCIYMANGDYLPGNDCVATVALPLQMFKHGKVTFTASERPDFFVWRVVTPEGTYHGIIGSWSDTLDRRMFSEWRDKATVISHRYFICPTKRFDANAERLYINSFGLGAAFVAAPVYGVASLFVTDIEDDGWWLWYLGKLMASICIALSAVILYGIACLYLPNSQSFVLAMFYGLGTGVWSISSQTLWQHGPNALFLACAISSFIIAIRPNDGESDSEAAGIAGFMIGMAFLCRPTSAIMGVAFMAWFICHRRNLAFRYALGALPFAVFCAFYNWYYLGSPFTFAQAVAGHYITGSNGSGAELLSTPLYFGLYAQFLSISRGLWVYSPFLILALFGYLVSCKNNFQELWVVGTGAILVIAVESVHFDWWSGYSYGPRHIVDMSFPLCLLMIPVWRQWLSRPVLWIAFAYSVAVQFTGALAFDVNSWHQLGGRDVNMVEHRGRFFDRHDSEIYYYMRNFNESRHRKHVLMADRLNPRTDMVKESDVLSVR